MLYQKKGQSILGLWVKGADVTSGTKARLVSEATPTEGEYGMQDVAKIKIEGDNEIKNVRLNNPTVNGLIEAFGTDSKEWVNKVLTLQTEKMVVAGKRVTALYLVPDGYALKEDTGGYLAILPVNKSGDTVLPEDPSPSDIPSIEYPEQTSTNNSDKF